MSEPLHALDEDPGEAVRSVLALGSNLGDSAATLQGAVDDLAGFEGIQVTAVSPVVQSVPVGGPPQPDYLNAVVLVRTTLSPLALLGACQRVETDRGRRRVIRWGPRTLDIDLIRYGGLRLRSTDLELPHPRAAERAFVLQPWLAVDPEATLPGRDGELPVAGLLARAPDAPGVRWRPDLTLRVQP